MSVGAILEQVRPWVSTAALMGLLEFARRLWVQNRQLRLVENKDDRDGYGVLIAALNETIRMMDVRHTAEIAAVRAEHKAQLERIESEHRRCEDRLAKIEGELMGFHRQTLLRSQHEAVEVPASGVALAAGERAIRAAARALDDR